MDNRNEPADVFIRAATTTGLEWDGILANGRAWNARVVQAVPRDLACAVLVRIARNKRSPASMRSLTLIMQKALHAGQTIGGWGGPFCCWDEHDTPKEVKVPTTGGQYK